VALSMCATILVALPTTPWQWKLTKMTSKASFKPKNVRWKSYICQMSSPLQAKSDRNYTAMRTHVWQSVHLSALLITWFTWGGRLQRRYSSDVAFCIVHFPLTVDNSDMN
jgi:hypothetical protein